MSVSTLKSYGADRILLFLALSCSVLFSQLLLSSEAAAAITVTPSTWNIIGLDSNSPTTGPRYFPVGAKVCSTAAVSNVAVDFNLSASSYITQRSGSLSSITIPSIAAGACADAYFEVEVSQTSAAYDTSASYTITAGGPSTPTPRELYVEHLISQSRNSITDVKLNGVSIPAGGAMNLVVGNTYTIELDGGTATQGYNQFEAFINFPNTIFQVLNVSTTYSADSNTANVPNPNSGLYANACIWDSDPGSISYRSCIGSDDKAGGSSVKTIYTIKILSGGGTSQQLNTLLYDFSGSSFHYNGDYSTGTRIANIIDPTNIAINKKFSPNPTMVNGISTLTLTLNNPNAGAISGVSFSDDFPTGNLGGGTMKVASTPNISNSCGGTLTSNTSPFNPLVANDIGMKLSGATIPANGSCTVSFDITANTVDTYHNTTSNVTIGTLNTGKSNWADLSVTNTPTTPTPPSACSNPVTIAQWTMPTAQGTTVPPLADAGNLVPATASFSTPANQTINTTLPLGGSTAFNSWSGWGWNSSNPASATPYFLIDVQNSLNYGGISIAFAYYLDGSWQGKSTNGLYVDSSPDNSTWSSIYSSTAAQKNTTGLSLPATRATTSGTDHTYFRIRASSAQYLDNRSALLLDNITITGCPHPPPNISKSFGTNPVAVNGVSTLTFTIVNPNSDATSGTQTGVKFVDNLPDGLVVANTPNASTTCGGSPSWSPAAGATTLNFGQTTGATLTPGQTCTVKVDIKATTAGPHANISNRISSTEGGENKGASGIATATLTAITTPAIEKHFSPNPIKTGGVSTLTFRITNPNPTQQLTGVAFSDTFQGTLQIASTPNKSTANCGTPTFNPTAGATSITFSNGTIAANTTCTVTVDVTATNSGSSITINNTTSAVTANVVGGTATATDSLTVDPTYPVIAIFKEVAAAASAPSPSSVLWGSDIVVKAGDNVYYQFTVQNDGDVPLDSVTVTDADLAAVDPSLSLANCVWKNGDDAIINPGNPSAQNFSLVVANNSNNQDFAYCIIGPITAASGTKTNTATVNAKYSGTAITPDSSMAIYNGFTAPTVTKSFGTGNIASGGSTTLTLTLGNPATNPGSLTTLQVNDTFPNGLTLKDTTFTFTPAACGTVTKTTGAASAAGDNNIRFSVASLAANATCQVQVNVTSSTAGAAANATANQTSSGIIISGKTAPLSLTGTAANATLNIYSPPTLAKTFGAASITSGGNTSLTLTLGNPGANPGAITSIQVDDTFPSGLTLKDTSFAFTPGGCGAVTRTSGVASAASDNNIRFSAASIAAGATCQIQVNVTSSTPGAITNTSAAPTAAGPASLTGSAASASLTVGGAPSITLIKSYQTVSDPINGSTAPKTIPGAVIRYTIQAINSGSGAADINSTVVTDPLPANTVMCVSATCSTPPVDFTCSATPPCGLSFNYAANVTYSNQVGGGSPYNYTVSPDSNGYDANVTGVRFNPTGAFSAASGGNNATFNLLFNVKIK